MDTTTVRQAELKDLDEYVKLAARFHAASPMHNFIDFDAEGYANFFITSLEKTEVKMWLAEKNGEMIGIAGAILFPLYFNPSTFAVQELWWWLTPNARGSGAAKQMYQCIENWAKETEASALFMIALEDDRVEKMEKLYTRAGYKPMERTFCKGVMSWQ
jgi:N-acetylglutamate synthase-like GNAT family acetyltransferase